MTIPKLSEESRKYIKECIEEKTHDYKPCERILQELYVLSSCYSWLLFSKRLKFLGCEK